MSSCLLRFFFVVMAVVLLASPRPTHACTRALYLGPESQIVTGRTMDWRSDMQTNLWVYPRGLERTSNTTRPFRWTSRYGSVTASIYEGGTADGMNERGLVANLLYLAEAEYAPATDDRPTLSIAGWAQ